MKYMCSYFEFNLKNTYSGGIRLIRMVFLRYEQKQHAIPQLDTV